MEGGGVGGGGRGGAGLWLIHSILGHRMEHLHQRTLVKSFFYSSSFY